MSNKHEAVLPDGSIGKRKSANRVYTHCVAIRMSYENALFNAKVLLSVDESNYKYYRAYLDGTSEWLVKPAWKSDEAHAKDCEVSIDRAKEALEGCESIKDYAAKLLKERVAKIEAAKAKGYYDNWQVYGWNGRHDLAVKQANSLRGSPWIAEVAVCDATIKS